MTLTKILNGLNDFPKASRTTNPASSHEAERGVTESGRRTTNATLVYRALSAAGTPLTARELAERLTAQGYDGFTRDSVSKRLFDLEQGGLVARGEQRACSVAGRKMLTWEVK